jgi:DNA-binding MarR family transcriptional regulator
MNSEISDTARETDPFDSMLGYHLRRLSVAAMTDLAGSLARLGLKPVDASILFVISSHSGITQSEVGRSLGILRANMAPLIAGLTKKGLIEREPVDGRSQALRLSTRGRALCRQAREATRQHEDRMFGTLTPAARARMISQLRALWQAKS